ncbi:VOC family protein [Paenibacillus sp. RC67]|uniref:VOC family protein n=1 Tax=Paenibacillus sp. RC67 TaxID=3039392 RepID=UPI0024ADD306|nr:VOC family protein [Paenibacillus sp. RC67]
MNTMISPIMPNVESVFIHVSDLQKSAEWYSMVMGLPLLQERLNGGNVYWFMLEGGTGIILDDNSSNEPDVPHVRFMYKTLDIRAAHQYMMNHEISSLSSIDTPHQGLSFFRFTDADGNSLMVTQSDYKSEVVKPLDSANSPIRNRISGIFLNVTDMNRAMRFHRKVLGLPYDAELGQEVSIHPIPMSVGANVLLDNNRFRHGDNYETLFMLATSDVEAAKEYLQSNSVSIFTDIERYGDMAFFTVKDPDDNVIMICSDAR